MHQEVVGDPVEFSQSFVIISGDGSSLRLPLVITSGRLASRMSKWCSGGKEHKSQMLQTGSHLAAN